MYSRLVDQYGSRIPMPRKRQSLQGSYDVIKQWDDSDHWAYATGESSAALDTQAVRQKLENAARYEFRNNSYAKGIVLKQANAVLGKGPRLEIEPDDKSDSKNELANELERNFTEYCDEINFVQRLRVGLIERPIGGEIFHVFRANPRLETVPVDFEQYEGRQFQTPWYQSQLIGNMNREYPPLDGLEFDMWGNVSMYHRLKYHPDGTQFGGMFPTDVDYVDPQFCVHMFRKERPSQYRGVSELAPCLQLFSKLRRYTEAFVKKAEQSAKIVGSMETNFAPEACANIGDDPMEIEIGGGTFLNLPDGWKANPFLVNLMQGYSELKREVLHEINSAFLIPWNVAAGDSSDYNFASGRLDYSLFYVVVDIIRNEMEKNLLKRFVRFWLPFADLKGMIPDGLGPFRFSWHWDEREAIDSEKQARTDTTYQGGGLLDEERFWRERGKTATEAIKQHARLQILRMKAIQEEAKLQGVELGETLPDGTMTGVKPPEPVVEPTREPAGATE